MMSASVERQQPQQARSSNITDHNLPDQDSLRDSLHRGISSGSTLGDIRSGIYGGPEVAYHRMFSLGAEGMEEGEDVTCSPDKRINSRSLSISRSGRCKNRTQFRVKLTSDDLFRSFDSDTCEMNGVGKSVRGGENGAVGGVDTGGREEKGAVGVENGVEGVERGSREFEVGTGSASLMGSWSGSISDSLDRTVEEVERTAPEIGNFPRMTTNGAGISDKIRKSDNIEDAFVNLSVSPANFHPTRKDNEFGGKLTANNGGRLEGYAFRGEKSGSVQVTPSTGNAQQAARRGDRDSGGISGGSDVITMGGALENAGRQLDQLTGPRLVPVVVPSSGNANQSQNNKDISCNGYETNGIGGTADVRKSNSAAATGNVAFSSSSSASPHARGFTITPPPLSHSGTSDDFVTSAAVRRPAADASDAGLVRSNVTSFSVTSSQSSSTTNNNKMFDLADNDAACDIESTAF